MIQNYRNWREHTRFSIYAPSAEAQQGFLLKPRLGQVIVLDSFGGSGYADPNAELTLLYNVQLCIVDAAGIPVGPAPTIIPVSPMYRILPGSAVTGQSINFHHQFEQGTEIELGQDAGLGWYAQDSLGLPIAGNVYAPFTALSLWITGRFEAAGLRSRSSNAQFQPLSI